MSFEMMLSQMPNLQQKFFICPMEEAASSDDGPEGADESAGTRYDDRLVWVGKKQKELDRALTATKIPTILLERLKREFDEVEALK